MSANYYYFLLLLVLATALNVTAQTKASTSSSNLPKEVRGYKVHRAQVELQKTKETEKKTSKKNSEKNSENEEYQEVEPLLITLGEAELVSVTPLGVTFDVPVILAAVKQEGDVDRLVFEDMKVNDKAVTVD